MKYAFLATKTIIRQSGFFYPQVSQLVKFDCLKLFLSELAHIPIIECKLNSSSKIDRAQQ